MRGETPNLPRRSMRGRIPKEPCNLPCCKFAREKLEEMDDVEIPKDAKEALSGPQAAEWRAAMLQELQTMVKLDAWDVVRRPKDVNVVGSKWYLL